MDDGKIEVEAMPFAIPGAAGAFRIQLLNEDQSRGVVTSDAGRSLGPGGFLTHAAGQTHGPHESRGGARVLTVQQWQSRDGSFDFEPA